MAAQRQEGHPLLSAQAVRGRRGARGGGATPALDLEHLPRAPAAAGHRGATRRTRPDRRRAGSGVLDVLQRIDLETSLAEGLLTKADRASMSSALELRAPFLDQAVMEFAASLPVDGAGAGRDDEGLPQALRAPLPAVAGSCPAGSAGSRFPLARWLRGPLHDWAASRLGDDRLRMAGVDPDAAVAPARSAPEAPRRPRESPLDAHRAGGVGRVGVLPGQRSCGGQVTRGRHGRDGARRRLVPRSDGSGEAPPRRLEQPAQPVGDLGRADRGREHEVRARPRGPAARSSRRLRDENERDLLRGGIAAQQPRRVRGAPCPGRCRPGR